MPKPCGSRGTVVAGGQRHFGPLAGGICPPVVLGVWLLGDWDVYSRTG